MGIKAMIRFLRDILALKLAMVPITKEFVLIAFLSILIVIYCIIRWFWIVVIAFFVLYMFFWAIEKLKIYLNRNK